MNALMSAVADGDAESAQRRVKELRGPAGKMLTAGVANLGRSRDLVEEVMYERLLITKTKLQAALPFITHDLRGVGSSARPPRHGHRHHQHLQADHALRIRRREAALGGISEALITTKFGLVVAIPSLLLHAYLSRKARSITTKMESAAVRFANEVAMSDEFGPAAAARATVAGRRRRTRSA